MPRDISFPDAEPFWASDRDGVAFLALVDGQPLRCVITVEALHDTYGSGPTEEDALKAFKDNRDAIRTTARKKIEIGDYSRWGDVLIRSIDNVPRANYILHSSYQKEIFENPDWQKVVDPATNVLANIILKSGRGVQSRWLIIQKEPTPIFEVSLFNTDEQVKTSEWFSLEQLKDPARLRVRMERLWGDYLQALSHKQVEAISGKVAS